MSKPKFDSIVYDIELMRPACVLLQVTFGADSAVAHLFDTNDWLVAPTDNMRRYKLNSDDDLMKLVRLTKEFRENREAMEFYDRPMAEIEKDEKTLDKVE